MTSNAMNPSSVLRVPRSTTSDLRRRAAWIALAGSGLMGLFWALYFAGLLEMGNGEELVSQYEAAFPLADAALTVLLAMAGIGLLRGRPQGSFCLGAGAAMALYLGLLDLSFYAQRGLYIPLRSDGILELGLNLLCIGGGLTALRLAWRLWRAGS